MSWTTALANLTASALRVFADRDAAGVEQVTLPAGPVEAVVDLPGQALSLAGQVTIEHQAHAAITLADANAAALREQDPVMVRGITYLVHRFVPDGGGLTRVLLMRPGAESVANPEWRPWR